MMGRGREIGELFSEGMGEGRELQCLFALMIAWLLKEKKEN